MDTARGRGQRLPVWLATQWLWEESGGRGVLLIVTLSSMATSACQTHSQTLKNDSRRRRTEKSGENVPHGRGCG